MPAKGKRVASRQAQLNRRKRRQTRAAGDDAAGMASSTEAAPTSAVIAPPNAASAAGATARETGNSSGSPARATISRSAARGQTQNRAGQEIAYRSLAPELRRILILAGILTVVLIAVSFVV